MLALDPVPLTQKLAMRLWSIVLLATSDSVVNPWCIDVEASV